MKRVESGAVLVGENHHQDTKRIGKPKPLLAIQMAKRVSDPLGVLASWW